MTINELEDALNYHPTPAPAITTVTYFVQAAGGGPIKIGVSDKPASRLKTLQVGHHEELVIVGTVEGNQEKKLHETFKSQRIRGEWFTANAALVRWMLRHVRFATGEKEKLLFTLPALEVAESEERRQRLVEGSKVYRLYDPDPSSFSKQPA
jgi:Meiotically Up-regulated Gene 113 (MUG113) protein